MAISLLRNGLLKFIIERSEIRKKQHEPKSVHFVCTDMDSLFRTLIISMRVRIRLHDMEEKATFVDFFSKKYKKHFK